MNISDFYKGMYIDAGAYDNLRSIASVCDGLKNSGRKVAHTVLQKNITKEVKVSRLKSTVSEYTEYLHGEDNLSSVVVNMAKRYVGTNNLPLLRDEGNYGKRYINEASADRYISTAGEKYINLLYPKIDNNILIEQEFEGVDIEARFFVPILPMILVNGSPSAMGYGFSQNILPRHTKHVVKMVEHFIETGKIVAPKPGWDGFKGTVRQGDQPNKWIVVGKIKRVNTTTIQISEIPIGIELKKYQKILDDLVDNKIINSYKDNSENDEFNFTIRVSRKFCEMTDEEILDSLKLIDKGKRFFEKYTVMGPDNRVLPLETIEEIFEEYAKIRLEFYDKRKQYLIDSTIVKIKSLASKYLFIKAVTENTIIINKLPKAKILEQIESHGKILPDTEGSFDFLLRLPIYSLTLEKMDELLDEIKKEKESLNKHRESDPKNYWSEDIKKFKEVMGFK